MSAPLFAYPRVLHKRTQTPPVYKSYKSYKSFLKTEFFGRCVYCQTLDSLNDISFFGADHYRPQEWFPHLSAEYLNLYYCCNRCNSHKGDYWPTAIQHANSQYIPNPCEYRMFEHLRFQGGEVVYASGVGEWTIEKLDLNAPEAIDIRNAFIQAKKAFEYNIAGFEQDLEQLQALIANETDLSKIHLAQADIDDINTQLTALRAAYAKFSN
jgi:hypothetical protein